MSKGSGARPFTDRKTFEENFDRIFGKKEKDGNEPDTADTKKTEE